MSLNIIGISSVVDIFAQHSWDHVLTLRLKLARFYGMLFFWRIYNGRCARTTFSLTITLYWYVTYGTKFPLFSLFVHCPITFSNRNKKPPAFFFWKILSYFPSVKSCLLFPIDPSWATTPFFRRIVIGPSCISDAVIEITRPKSTSLAFYPIVMPTAAFAMSESWEEKRRP